MHFKAVRRADIASGACRKTGSQPLMGIQGQNICLVVPDDFSLTGKFVIFTQQSFPCLMEHELWYFFYFAYTRGRVSLIKSQDQLCI